MNKFIQVVMLVVVANIGNSMAAPRQEADKCSPSESEAVQSDVTAWAARVVAESASIGAAAQRVTASCDADKNGALSASEFIDCIKSISTDSSISEECYNFLHAAGDANGDGTVGVAELTQLFTMVAGPGSRNLNRNKRSAAGRQGVACTPEDTALLQSSVDEWLVSFLKQGLTPQAVALKIQSLCDSNNDSSLSTNEFVGCLQDKLSRYGISDSCFRMLVQSSDGNAVISVDQLVDLISTVSIRK